MIRDVYCPPEYRGSAIENAIGKLKSFYDGDIAIQTVVECGHGAISKLRALLLQRESSGLFQARVRAVEALSALGAHKVLLEFLKMERQLGDPVERLGEDAVINAAARALAYRNDPGLFEVLTRLACRPCLTGVIFTLGTFRKAEVIPLLIEALSEDASRLTAERALVRMGTAARTALTEIADRSPDCHQRESESQLRQRRSARRVLSEIEVTPRK
jgi:hypothetical protein